MSDHINDAYPISEAAKALAEAIISRIDANTLPEKAAEGANYIVLRAVAPMVTGLVYKHFGGGVG